MAKEYTVTLGTKDMRRIVKALVKERGYYAVDANAQRLYKFNTAHTINALKHYEELSQLINFLNSALEGDDPVEIEPESAWVQNSMFDSLGV